MFSPVRVCPRQIQHDRLGPLKGIAQFDECNRFHLGKRFNQLRFSDSVMAEDEFDISYVLLVVPPHHFGQNQIDRCRSEQFK
jgi:hypothetical protein